MGDARAVLIAACATLAIWFVLWTWVRTRSVVPTVGALLLGAVVLWGVNNVQGIREKVEEDIKEHGGAEVVNGRG
ncbi:MAG TPA: hypothetical protein VIL36_03450 [Acidimicrobiales bacterium]